MAKLRLIFQGCAIILGIALAAEPREGVADELKIMAEDASEPFSRPDGTGYANDIVRAAFHAAGVEVQFDVVPYARCKWTVESGNTPACLSMSWAEEFKGTVVFSDEPIFAVHADVFRRTASPLKILRAEDLGKGTVVGIVNGYEYPAEVSRIQSSGAVLERGINEAAILKMLARGRVDAAVVMTSDFEPESQRARDAGVADHVTLAFRSGTLQSYIGFSVKNPQGEWARQKFDAGYKRIISSGMRDMIKAQWMRKARH